MIEFISVARTFNCRPSDMLDGIGSYAAYCFDSAAAIYVQYLKQEKKPIKNGHEPSNIL